MPRNYTFIHFIPSLIFAGREIAIRAEFCERRHSGKLLALPISNNVHTVTNTLAYYATVFIWVVKSFIILSPGGALFINLS
jgi:hypothetical protein